MFKRNYTLLFTTRITHGDKSRCQIRLHLFKDAKVDSPRVMRNRFPCCMSSDETKRQQLAQPGDPRKRSPSPRAAARAERHTCCALPLSRRRVPPRRRVGGQTRLELAKTIQAFVVLGRTGHYKLESDNNVRTSTYPEPQWHPANALIGEAEGGRRAVTAFSVRILYTAWVHVADFLKGRHGLVGNVPVTGVLAAARWVGCVVTSGGQARASCSNWWVVAGKIVCVRSVQHVDAVTDEGSVLHRNHATRSPLPEVTRSPQVHAECLLLG